MRGGKSSVAVVTPRPHLASGIARVWFTIEPYKVTEQWDKEI